MDDLGSKRFEMGLPAMGTDDVGLVVDLRDVPEEHRRFDLFLVEPVFVLLVIGYVDGVFLKVRVVGVKKRLVRIRTDRSDDLRHAIVALVDGAVGILMEFSAAERADVTSLIGIHHSFEQDLLDPPEGIDVLHADEDVISCQIVFVEWVDDDDLVDAVIGL